MDALDLLILKTASSVVITSISSSAGNLCGNVITVEFGISQPPDMLQQQPWSRLNQWMISDGFFELNSYRSFRIDSIPEMMNADEIGEWLAAELSYQGKHVLLKKWIAPMRFNEVEYPALR